MSDMISFSKERKKGRNYSKLCELKWRITLMPWKYPGNNHCVFVKLGSNETLNWAHMTYIIHCDLIQSV